MRIINSDSNDNDLFCLSFYRGLVILYVLYVIFIVVRSVIVVVF